MKDKLLDTRMIYKAGKRVTLQDQYLLTRNEILREVENTE